MRKILFLCVIMCILCLMSVSCGKTETEHPDITTEDLQTSSGIKDTTSQPNSKAWETFLELKLDKNVLPTAEEYRSVKNGMSCSEIFSIVGAPQRTQKFSAPREPTLSFAEYRDYYCYDTEENITLMISFEKADEDSEPVAYIVIYCKEDGSFSYPDK